MEVTASQLQQQHCKRDRSVTDARNRWQLSFARGLSEDERSPDGSGDLRVPADGAARADVWEKGRWKGFARRTRVAFPAEQKRNVPDCVRTLRKPAGTSIDSDNGDTAQKQKACLMAVLRAL